MNTIELLRQNFKDGIRLPYPADAPSIEQLKTFTPLTIRDGKFFFDHVCLYESGKKVFLTAYRVCGIIWLKLSTLDEE